MIKMARNWREVRGEALNDGRVTEAGIAEARAAHQDQVHGFRLRQIREARAALQEEIAQMLNVTQSRVSRIEGGDLRHTELGTIVDYVGALGGTVRVTADFGDEKLTISEVSPRFQARGPVERPVEP
jgi:predicted XRE-type DNA-binding protein